MNIKAVLNLANEEFETAQIDNYFFETRLIMSYVLGKSKEWIISNMEYELSSDEYNKFIKLKNDRIQGNPLQYILGEEYFMGMKFVVNSSVLIPRADTENLVYEIINITKGKNNIRILDLCTGSGCIAISLAKNIKNSEVYASDVSKEALEVAEKNAEINNVNIKFFYSDLFENIPHHKFDIIVSNPPYITEKEMGELSKEVLNEPQLALYGGEDGLEFYKKISQKAKDFLNDEGILAFEIGYKQAEDVKSILELLNYTNIKVIKDYSGNDRVITAQKV